MIPLLYRQGRKAVSGPQDTGGGQRGDKSYPFVFQTFYTFALIFKTNLFYEIISN